MSVNEIVGDAILLRIFIGESDRVGHRLLWEEIVRRARAAGLAGATVTRAIAGYGASSRLHTHKFIELSQDLPIVIEIVDRADKIETFRPTIVELVREGLVTTEKVGIWIARGQTPEEKARHGYSV